MSLCEREACQLGRLLISCDGVSESAILVQQKE